MNWPITSHRLAATNKIDGDGDGVSGKSHPPLCCDWVVWFAMLQLSHFPTFNRHLFLRFAFLQQSSEPVNGRELSLGLNRYHLREVSCSEPEQRRTILVAPSIHLTL